MTIAMAMVLFLAAPASATWSIVAVDPDTGEVGAAMAACSAVSALGNPDEVPVPIVLVPGRGVAVAQGQVDPTDLVQLRMVLADVALSADEVVTRVVADNDPEAQSVRQYAVVTGDSVAVVSGEDSETASATAEGPLAGAQGVALTDSTVIGQAMTAFVEAQAEGQPLVDALVAALAAGSQAGGDRSCGDQTSLFAHVAVAGPDEDGVKPARLLTVTVDEGDGQNPVILLSEAHQAGRTGWIDAGQRPPTTIPRWLVLIVGGLMALASVIVIRFGMGFRGRPTS